MNILDAEDMIKGLPDQALMQEAQMPSGQMPQFLVVSEIQRRSDMRKRYQAQQQEAMPSVKDQIVQEGIMGAMPQQPMGMPPQGMPQGMPVMGMAAGGITSMPGAGALSGFQAEYIDPLLEQAKVLARTAGTSIEEAYTALKREAQMNMPNYGMLAKDLSFPSLPSLPMPERRSQEEMGQMFTPEQVESRLAAREELLDNRLLAQTPAEALESLVEGGVPTSGIANIATNAILNTPIGIGARGVKAAIETLGARDDAEGAKLVKPGIESVSPVDEVIEEVQETYTDASDPDYKMLTEAFDGLGGKAGGKEVQSTSSIQKQSLGLEDLISDSRRMAQANALMQLGAGIAGGDLSKGISAAGVAASKGMQDARTLEMRKRLAEYQAGRQDLARKEEARQFEKTFGLSERRVDALIEQNASTTQRERLRTLVSLYENELDETKRSGLQRQIQQLLAELGGQPMVVDGMQAGAVSFTDLARG